MKKIIAISILFTLAICQSCSNNHSVIEQATMEKVSMMPTDPSPYKMLDWNEKTKNFDDIIFNHQPDSQADPFIWIDNSKRNFPQATFGLYTVIGDIRQGPKVNNGEFHEAINSLGALISAGLVGIDKTNQDGYNYPEMVQNYFNSDNGWNIMMNNTSATVALQGGGY
jgi:hypothetical protein